MKLKKIEIAGLWQEECNISWDLNDDVNILVGNNGAGKSTIFALCSNVIPPFSMKKHLSQKADQIRLTFEDDYRIECVNFMDSFEKLQEKASTNPSYKTMYEEISDDIGERKKARLDFGIHASFTQFYHKTELVDPEQFEDMVNVDVISTFDAPLRYEEDESSTFKESREQRPMSHLDKRLRDCMEEYSYYIGNLANTIEQKIMEEDTMDSGFVQEVYSHKHLFGEILNGFLRESGKTIDLSKSKPEFLLTSGKHISMYDLSSGEKQILYIMLRILLQREREYIVFLDEPELSLHVDWQEVLIDKILELNPNCQLLISTHSPSLLFAGWDSKVVNIDDLKV